MKIEIRIDEKYPEPKILVLTEKMTDEVQAILDKLSEDQPSIITGFREGLAEILEAEDLVRIYASDGKVIAVTSRGPYILRLRLYEAEARLSKKDFVRISNSEIINLKKVKRFDLSFAGTICVELKNGDVSYVSRRYVSKIKKILGI